MPRDREGDFEPRLIGKHERHFTGFDDKIIALYARGMTVRDIQAFLAEMYATEVTPDFISAVTDAVLTAITVSQSRPLEPMYPVIPDGEAIAGHALFLVVVERVVALLLREPDPGAFDGVAVGDAVERDPVRHADFIVRTPPPRRRCADRSRPPARPPPNA